MKSASSAYHPSRKEHCMDALGFPFPLSSAYRKNKQQAYETFANTNLLTQGYPREGHIKHETAHIDPANPRTTRSCRLTGPQSQPPTGASLCEAAPGPACPAATLTQDTCLPFVLFASAVALDLERHVCLPVRLHTQMFKGHSPNTPSLGWRGSLLVAPCPPLSSWMRKNDSRRWCPSLRNPRSALAPASSESF